MYKNFAAQGLGISGRQSELIELAMTYAFAGLDIDLIEMTRRVQRSDYDNAARFLNAAKIGDRKLFAGGFDVPVDLDAEDESFTSQLGQLHPMAETAAKLECKVATVVVPAATDRLPYHEYFEVITKRLGQIAETLAKHEIRLGVGFTTGTEADSEKQFEFIKNVEGFLPLVRGSGDNIGYTIDTCNWFAGGGTQEGLAELPVDQIVAVRFSGLSESATPGEPKAEDRTLPEVGGKIDFVAIANHLKAGGYAGPISVCGSGSSVRGGSREAVLGKASDFMDALFTEVGVDVIKKPMDELPEVPADVLDG